METDRNIRKSISVAVIQYKARFPLAKVIRRTSWKDFKSI